MVYCPNCGEDGDEVPLDCGHTKCIDCASLTELLAIVCETCLDEEEVKYHERKKEEL